MAVTPDPRTPYHEEPHTAPPQSMMDIASAFWIVLAAALAAGVLIWLISATSIEPPVSVDFERATVGGAAHHTARTRAGDAARTDSIAMWS